MFSLIHIYFYTWSALLCELWKNKHRHHVSGIYWALTWWGRINWMVNFRGGWCKWQFLCLRRTAPISTDLQKTRSSLNLLYVAYVILLLRYSTSSKNFQETIHLFVGINSLDKTPIFDIFVRYQRPPWSPQLHFFQFKNGDTILASVDGGNFMTCGRHNQFIAKYTKYRILFICLPILCVELINVCTMRNHHDEQFYYFLY